MKIQSSTKNELLSIRGKLIQQIANVADRLQHIHQKLDIIASAELEADFSPLNLWGSEMGRKSKIESHPQSKIIIKRLAGGEEYSTILLDFPQLTRFDLDYYRENKLESVLSKSPELKEEIEGDLGNDTLAEVRTLKTKAIEILTQAQNSGDLRTALLGIREARGCLEAILKAEGQIKEQTINVNTQVNILELPEWIAFRTLIINALEPYPEAKEAVVNALRD